MCACLRLLQWRIQVSHIFSPPTPKQCQSHASLSDWFHWFPGLHGHDVTLMKKLFSFVEPRRKLSEISFEPFSPLYCVLESASVFCSCGLWTLAPYTGSDGLAGTSCPYLGPQTREPPWAHARPPSRVAKYGWRSVCIPVDHSDIPNGRHGWHRRAEVYLSAAAVADCHPVNWNKKRAKLPHWQPETSRR